MEDNKFKTIAKKLEKNANKLRDNASKMFSDDAMKFEEVEYIQNDMPDNRNLPNTLTALKKDKSVRFATASILGMVFMGSIMCAVVFAGKNASYQDKIDENSKLIAKNEETISQYKAQLKDLNSDLQQYKSQLESYAKKEADYQNQIKQYNEKISGYEAASQNYQNTIHDLNTKIDTNYTSRQELESQLAEKDSQIAALQNELAKAKDKPDNSYYNGHGYNGINGDSRYNNNDNNSNSNSNSNGYNNNNSNNNNFNENRDEPDNDSYYDEPSEHHSIRDFFNGIGEIFS